jgi:hypothetical protein
MSLTMHLHGSPGSLQIDIADNGWAQCTLMGDQDIYLGADVISIVADRILRGLKGIRPTPQRQTMGILGYQAFSAMLLAEAHHCLWVANESDATYLIWQNANHAETPFVGTIRLTNEDAARWTCQFQQIERELAGTDAWMKVPELCDY